MKEIFKNYIEKKLVGSYKDIALHLMKCAPDYFWEIPASTSGKYHPITDLGKGGLVRHSLMVARVMEDLLKMESDFTDDETFSLLIIASLFHDVKKCGDQTENFTTEHIHPGKSAIFCMIGASEVHDTIVSADWIFKLGDIVMRHMGRWTTSKYSDVTLPEPNCKLSKLLHEADYIASRKYCLYDEEYFNNL